MNPSRWSVVCLLIFGLMFAGNTFGQQPVSLTSPDGRIQLSFSDAKQTNTSTGELTYAVSFQGKPVIVNSPLGLQLERERSLGAAVRSIGRDATVAAGLQRLSGLVARTHEPPLAAPGLLGIRITIGTGTDAITMQRGERLAITGPSGCGKTSLLTCLAGLQDTCGLPVAIDGRPVADCPAQGRRPLFALSPQDAQMIAGTIADNLRLARSGLSDAAMWDALAIACLADEVRAMPQGMMTWIGDGGTRLSGGQRKRLSVARALLAGRPWLLLDEPSEGLDGATEQQLKDELVAWLDRTQTGLIVVTHRPAMLALTGRQLTMAG